MTERTPGLELDHVGIVAAGASTPLSRVLADGALRPREMPSGVVVARFGAGRRFELVWPASDRRTPVDRYLANRGPGLHHIGIRVDGPLDSAIAHLRREGLEPIGPPELSSDGRWSVFLHPRTAGGVLVELLEGRPR